MATTFSLRDLGISPGQSVHEDLTLELPPYVQGGIEFADDHGGGKAPKSSVPAAQGISYEAAGGGTVPAKLDVTAMTEGISFWLRFDASYHGPCARCLEPASWDVSVDVHAVHDFDAEEPDLRSDHVDDAANLLDVTGWAQEEVGLRFPTRVLCRKDCRGLCPQCGVSLNDEPDHEHERPADSRWDALKNVTFDEAASED